MEQEKGVLFVCEWNYAMGNLVQPVTKKGREDKESYEQKGIPFLFFLSSSWVFSELGGSGSLPAGGI